MTAAAGTRPAGPVSERHTSRAIAAIAQAARTEHDFPGWLAGVLAAAAGQIGGSDELITGRGGSWEASLVGQLAKGTVGYDDECLPSPAGRGMLTDARARQIREACDWGDLTQRQIAAEFGVSPGTVSGIATRRTLGVAQVKIRLHGTGEECRELAGRLPAITRRAERVRALRPPRRLAPGAGVDRDAALRRSSMARPSLSYASCPQERGGRVARLSFNGGRSWSESSGAGLATPVPDSAFQPSMTSPTATTVATWRFGSSAEGAFITASPRRSDPEDSGVSS
jgi:hypothetical protein